MTAKTFIVAALTALFAILSPISKANPIATDLTTIFSTNNSLTINPDEDCPPISNIHIDFQSNGEGWVSWAGIPGVSTYHVQVVNQNQEIIFDGNVQGNVAHIFNLEVGGTYTVTICYICPVTKEPICGTQTFNYIIFDDVIVMLSGEGACNCHLPVGTTGTCPGSGSFYYEIDAPRVYNIELVDGTKQSFIVDGGAVNPLGNCPSNLKSKAHQKHGALGLFLPYYDLGNSKIFFHGTTFCIDGAAVKTVTYCGLGNLNSRHSPIGMMSNWVYPNPFSDLLHLDFPTPVGAAVTLELYDSFGQLVLTQSLQANAGGNISMNVETASLQPGIYWVIVVQKNTPPLVKRIVKLQ